MAARKGINPIHLDLRPNRDLLDPNFEGYKLSLDKLPLYSLPLESGVDHARLSEEQYSIQHFKLQVFSNHILADPWNPDIVYHVGEDWTVNKSVISQEARKLVQIGKVWAIPEALHKNSNRFNVTLSFPNRTHVVLADGCGNYYLILTGDRKGSNEWKVQVKESPFSACKNLQFIILDTKSYKSNEAECTDLLLLRIDETAQWKEALLQQNKFALKNSKTEHPFVTVLEWITLTNSESTEKWTRKSLRTYVGPSSLDYASIEPNGTGLYIASNDAFYCCYDSEKPLEAKPEETAGLHERKEYLWSQPDGKIMLWFQLPPNAQESDVKVDVKIDEISVEYKDHKLLSGKLFKEVKVDGMTMALMGSKLEVIIPKLEAALTWTTLIPGNETGEEVMDAQRVEHIHTQLSHMCSEKWGDHPHNSDIVDTREIDEECDEFPADSALLMRVDKDLQKISHQTSLGSHQWLFNAIINPEEAVCLCVRHDVDGILWQPKLASAGSNGGGDNNASCSKNSWMCEHLSTFLALGYVQASKELRKFTICAKDHSYVAICDSSKHVHVYRKPSELENDLRNRKTGQKISHVSKQHVISIDSGLEILGAYAANDFMLILTAKQIVAVQMAVSEIY